MAGSRFDAAYYERLWGTVHRHDYTADLAARLLTHQPRRLLDLGTGCGRLVAELRARGVDAWGLEISEYALRHCCAMGFVFRGSVVDDLSRFPSGFFDVVHSQGLWEYIAEADVPTAWRECCRIGRRQFHNFDAAENLRPEDMAITIRPRAWWDAQLIGNDQC